MNTTTKKTNNTRKQTPPKPYHPAFGTIGSDVDLSIGILLAEDASGAYEIIGPVSTINEGIEIAQHDFARRITEVGKGGDPMHVEVYKIWSPNYDGDYSIVFEIRESNNIL